MKGISGWNYHPYRPFHRADEGLRPFVCRFAPGLHSVELEWFDKGCSGPHKVAYRKKKSYEPWVYAAADGPVVRIDGLDSYTDYELRVERCNEAGSSALRYVRTGEYPGSMVNYLHPEDEIYAFSGRALCSPSLVKLPSGALLASMDLFAPEQPQNLTLLFRSDDGSETWRYVCDLFPCYWGTLFMHRGSLYMLATSTEYGDVLIGRSDDEGETWSTPSVLFCGSSSCLAPGWQHTPVPIIVHEGRLCTSFDYGAWKCGGHGITLLSCDENADIMDSANWIATPPLFYDSAWPGAPKGKCYGLLEGNMVTAPDGTLVDLLRIQMFDCEPNHGVACALEKTGGWEDPLAFRAFVDMPTGSNSKTHILYDEVSGRYVGVGNLCVDDATPRQRNVLVMESSADLVSWKVDKILLDCRHMSPQEVGFQYISFIIDDDDLLVLSRTAINNARNYHDANCQTFHRVENFRQYF